MEFKVKNLYISIPLISGYKTTFLAFPEHIKSQSPLRIPTKYPAKSTKFCTSSKGTHMALVP